MEPITITGARPHAYMDSRTLIEKKMWFVSYTQNGKPVGGEAAYFGPFFNEAAAFPIVAFAEFRDNGPKGQMIADLNLKNEPTKKAWGGSRGLDDETKNYIKSIALFLERIAKSLENQSTHK